jgi:Arc/MetJ-type ribon-helix-helix transcriptional regulator
MICTYSGGPDMGQLNMHMTPEFEENLRRFMRLRGFTNKSEAIRVAVKEGLETARKDEKEPFDFKRWRGAALEGPTNPNPRFPDDDSIWAED